MALFQKNVLKDYLKKQDQKVVAHAYRAFIDYFHNKEVQQNIRSSKEEQFQATFLSKLFENVLGYTLFPDPGYNLTTEFKNEIGAQKADGAILKNAVGGLSPSGGGAEGGGGPKALAVIELKSTKTKELESIRKQAFDYKANHSECRYVITSNFEKLRFYINDAVDWLEFDLFRLSQEDFAVLYLCLQKDHLLGDLPQKVKNDSLLEEEKVTKKLYKDYSQFRMEVYHDLLKRNRRNTELKELSEKSVKYTLFKKTQKLLDRFLFIFFAEDRGLIPRNMIKTINNEWLALQKMRGSQTLYQRYQIYFSDLNVGNRDEDIFAYNGGLFLADPILDHIEIDDDLLYKHTEKLTAYDFESEVDVNILGHIFEHSLNEIESINAEIEGVDFDKQKARRKKDGVFYTPKYITKYIVDNTVGKLCEEKKAELEITAEVYENAKQRSKKRIDNLQQYREWLLQLSICDPACGSGAFLNQALEFLIAEHRFIDELSAKYNKDALVLSEVENSILENNLYGVDINQESVEIAKLSLWLRTAQRGRKLTSLSNNIKCGNSLIDSVKVAGDKAFKWEKEFPKVFGKGGFDVVIGNPPYVTFALGAKQKHDEKEVEFLKQNYPEASVYKVSSYLIFLEVGMKLLGKEGMLSYIIPNTYHTNYHYAAFRNQLIGNYHLEELLDLRYKVFADAEMGYTSIPTLTKRKQAKPTRVARINSFEDIINFKPFQVHATDFRRFPDTKFLFQKELMDIWFKAQESSVVLGNKGCFTFYNGTKTGNNSKFLVDENMDDLCKPVLRGKDFYRYVTGKFEKYIIFDKENLWSNTNDSHFKVPSKLLIRRTSDHLAVAYDPDQHYVLDTVHILYTTCEDFRESYVLCLLNSKLFHLLYRLIVPEGGKAFAEVKIVNLKKLPIKEASLAKQEAFGKMALLVQKSNREVLDCNQKLTNLLSAKYGVIEFSKKLQNWPSLDFKGFLKELQKAKVKLSLEEEVEWMEYFNKQKTKVQELQGEVDRLDKQIDEMVYELYGLTEEERGIVGRDVKLL